MRLFTGLLIGRESLLTHGSALSTVADNLANANTPGFKAERTEFNDLLASNLGSMFTDPLSAGSGVSVGGVSTLYSQGSIEQTGREFDVAINGNGFFVVNNGVDDLYTRAGNFATDPAGNLVTLTGESVMGFTTESPDTPVALSVNNISNTATASSLVTLNGNLDVQSQFAALPPAPTTFAELNASSEFSAPVSLVDSLGVSHEVALHFFHTTALGWQAQAYVDGEETGGVAGTPTSLATAEMTFLETGLQADGAAATLAITPAWANGAAATAVSIDLSNFTQFGSASAVSSVEDNGVQLGSLLGVNFDRGGVVSGVFDNGETAEIGTLALAVFVNEDGLTRVGDNKFTTSETTGEASTGSAGVDGRGIISGQSLEHANVDPAREFVEMIRLQRGYQASSKVITTMNTLLDRTIQIV